MSFEKVWITKTRSGKTKKAKKFEISRKKIKKSCLYYYNFIRFFGEHFISTNNDLKNNNDPIYSLGVMSEKRLMKPIDDLRWKEKGSSIRCKNYKSDDDGNKEKKDNVEDHRVNLKQKQKTPWAQNAKYFKS